MGGERVVAALVLVGLAMAHASFVCKEDQSLDLMFAPRWTDPSIPVFLGGDGATSLDLQDGRFLWIFGDTVVGHMEKSTGKKNMTAMPRNSIAIVTKGDMDPSHVSFFWRTDGASSKPQSFFLHPKEPDRWYWAIHGTVQKDLRTGSAQLFVFAFEVTFDSSPMGFLVLGTSVLVIPNVSERDPLQWKILMADPWPDRFLASALWVSNGFTYLYGWVDEGSRRGAVVSRLSDGAMQRSQWDSLEVWAGPSVGWTTRWEDGVVLFDKMTSEASILRRNDTGEYWMATLSLDERATYLRRSRDLLTWSDREELFRIPSRYYEPGIIWYAPKFHTEWADGTNDAPITFMTNGPWEVLFSRMDVYVPQFMRCTPAP